MPRTIDLLALDAQLKDLLEQPLAERQASLAALAHADPGAAQVLTRLLELAGQAHTTDLRLQGEVIDLIDAPAPVPVIPGYRIDQAIGQGGMATVYAGRRQLGDAEQLVAIKVLRAALPSAADRARFLTEQQILARLPHPHIATLLDVGVVDERPYMVLERIAGVPIDEWLPPGEAPVGAILDMLEQICDALALAHAHFVVHRDIKPANVLVSHGGHLKLIDFGIAKLLDEAGGRRGLTQDGNTPLTLRFASPEQLRGQAVGVTSDVYQVGLLAYWLCCGSWPFGDGRSDALAERLDPDALPVPPSRRPVARLRQRALAGDIDAIVLKCLRFHPSERYLDITALRADLQRHRAHQPVLARRHTSGYLLRGWLRRHRLAAVASGLLLLLAAGAVIATLSLAARNAEHAQRMDRVVATVAQMLTAADPYAHAPGSVAVDTVVAAAGDRLLAEKAPSDPRFQLRMLELLATLEERLQHPQRQQRLLEQAAALVAASGEAPERAQILEAEALAAQARAGDLEGALAGVAAFRQRHGGSTPPGLLQAQTIVHSDRGDFALATAALDALEAQTATDADALQRYEFRSERITLLTRADRLDEALALLRTSAALLDPALPAHQPAWLRHRATEATLLGQLGRYDQSAQALQDLATETRARLGAAHPRVLELTANAGVMWLEAARPRLAWTMLSGLDDAALAAAPAMSHAAVRITRAGAALYSGHADKVLPDLLAGLRLALATLGPQSPRLAYMLERTAWTLFELEQPELAIPFAAHAWRLSGQKRSAADFLLQLIALRMPVPNRPDPEFDARLPGDCDRQEFALLAALWSPGQPRPTATDVSADCLAISGMRLATLGLRWAPPDGLDRAPETLDTPILRRWLGQRSDSSPALTLDPAQRAELEEALRRLDAP